MENIDYTYIENYVKDFSTKYEGGFIEEEILEVLNHFPDINRNKFYDALFGITCLMGKDNETIIYRHDIFTAIICGLENRDLNWYEFD